MKAIPALALVLFFCLPCTAQNPSLTFSVASDTSYVLFSGIPKLMIARTGRGNSINFQMTKRDFKSFLEVTSFMQGSREVALKSLGTYESLLEKKDSAISILKTKYETEVKRTENFKTNFEDLKRVNQTYHMQLNACTADLQTLNNSRRKSKTWAFIKGALVGLAVGSVGVIAVDAAL